MHDFIPRLLAVLLLGSATFSFAAEPGTVAPDSTPLSYPQQARVVEGYGKLPLSFETNRGQTDPQVKFLSRGDGYSLFLTPSEAVLSLRGKSCSEPSKAPATLKNPAKKPQPCTAASNSVLRMRLQGGNLESQQA